MGAQKVSVQKAASQPWATPAARSTIFALGAPSTRKRYFTATAVAVARLAPLHGSSVNRVGTAVAAARISAPNTPAVPVRASSRAQLISRRYQPQHDRKRDDRQHDDCGHRKLGREV